MLQTIPVNLPMRWCGLYVCLYVTDLFCCFCRSYLGISSQQKRFQFCSSTLIMLFLWSAVMQAIWYLTIHCKQMRNNFCTYYRKTYGSYCSLYWPVRIIFLLVQWNAKSFIFILSFGWNATTKVIVTVMIHGGLRFNQQQINVSIYVSRSDHVHCVYSLLFVYWASSL